MTRAQPGKVAVDIGAGTGLTEELFLKSDCRRSREMKKRFDTHRMHGDADISRLEVVYA